MDRLPTPIASEGNDDIVGRLTGMSGWCGVLVHDVAGAYRGRDGHGSIGGANGDLLIGRQINVSIRRDFRSTLTNVLAVTLFSGGGLESCWSASSCNSSSSSRPEVDPWRTGGFKPTRR